MPEKSSFRLKSCPKHYTFDQDKFVTPPETVKTALERLRKRYDLSHVRIEPRKDAVKGAYSFSSISDQLDASGKGLTPEQSQASAIMEFVERYSWFHFDYEKYDGYTFKSFNEIKKGDIPTIDDWYFLHSFSKEIQKRKNTVKEIKDIPLKWIKGTSLMDYNKFYYPLNWHNYIYSANGMATGNAIEEAILQALCEVIERENIFRFFGERKIGNNIDKNSIKHPLVKKVLENALNNGIRFIIKDISFDFKVPTIMAHGISYADEGALTFKGCGYGTHPNPEKALIRALSEYFEGYSLLKIVEKEIPLDWNKIFPQMQGKCYGFLALFEPELFERHKKVIKINEIKDLSCSDIKDEIERILKILKKYHYDVVFMDKTYKDLRIPVARIFVPGMRNLMSIDYSDPCYFMSEVYYEAGNIEASRKYIRRFWQLNLERPPLEKVFYNPKKIFKKDYKETIKSSQALKKNSVTVVKEFAQARGLFVKPK